MSAPDVDELTEALLQNTDWGSYLFEGQVARDELGFEDVHWFYDGSLREFAQALVDGWEQAQDIARRRMAGEFGPDSLPPPLGPRWPDPELTVATLVAIPEPPRGT